MTRGLQMAGFHVTGVDIKPQPRYCGDAFIQGDALATDLSGYDAVFASPPCHDHSRVTGRSRKSKGEHGTGWMLEATIEKFSSLDVPWVVENVEGAIWPPAVFRVMLCGSMFYLDVRRHRWFASNTAFLVPSCEHDRQRPQFRTLDSRRKGVKNDELSQAIPPAYGRFLGRQVMAILLRERQTA